MVDFFGKLDSTPALLNCIIVPLIQTCRYLPTFLYRPVTIFQPFVLQILLVGARYQTHLVYSCGVAKQTSHILNDCLYQDFLAVLLLYIALAMRQSSGWACSANDKKKLFDLVRHFPALLFQSLFFLVGRLFSCPANSAYTRIRRPSVGRWQSQQMSVTAQQKSGRVVFIAQRRGSIINVVIISWSQCRLSLSRWISLWSTCRCWRLVVGSCVKQPLSHV